MDTLNRSFDRNVCQGHLCLSSVQLRGHAMFSDEERLKIIQDLFSKPQSDELQ
jgi:hypothetical protein